jgi:thymidine kinase
MGAGRPAGRGAGGPGRSPIMDLAGRGMGAVARSPLANVR